MAKLQALFTLDAICKYGDASLIEYIPNLINELEQISFTRIPTDDYIIIGSELIVIADSFDEIERLLDFCELCYSKDSEFCPMTISQIKDYTILDYFAYLNNNELKTVEFEEKTQHKYPELLGSKKDLANLVELILSGKTVNVSANNAQILEDALFSDDCFLQTAICLCFEPFFDCKYAEIVICQEQCQFTIICDDLRCIINNNTEMCLSDILQPIKTEFSNCLAKMTIRSDLIVEFNNSHAKDMLHCQFYEYQQNKWQKLLNLELLGFPQDVGGGKTAGDIFEKKVKHFKQLVKRKMREVATVQLQCQKPQYIEKFMGNRLDLWIKYLNEEE